MALKLIRTRQGFNVYYVEPENLKQTGSHKVYSHGVHGFVTDFDFKEYEKSIAEKGFPPPADQIGIVHPNLNALKPGIEIMPARSLFSRGGLNYYSLMDAVDLDNTSPSLRAKIQTYKRKRLYEIDEFLEKELYASCMKSRTNYEKNLVTLIKTHISHPENLFDLHILGPRNAYWTSFSSIDISKALDAGIRMDIDWMLANKLLGLYATMK